MVGSTMRKVCLCVCVCAREYGMDPEPADPFLPKCDVCGVANRPHRMNPCPGGWPDGSDLKWLKSHLRSTCLYAFVTADRELARTTGIDAEHRGKCK